MRRRVSSKCSWGSGVGHETSPPRPLQRIQLIEIPLLPPFYRFYYADERQSSGESAGMAISGPAAAEEYWTLVGKKSQGPWLHTFVKGEGYKDFYAGS